MYDDDVLSERVAFRLTLEMRRKLVWWAREEHRPLANLVYTLVCQAIAAEEQRRGKALEPTQLEHETL
jgi:hypothetical protein